MGRELVQAIAQSSSMMLSGALEHSTSAFIGLDAGEIAGVGKLGVVISTELADSNGFDVLIDFSRPLNSLSCLDLCVRQQKPMVIGTTGFDQQQQQAIRVAATQISLVWAANFSVGVNLLLDLLQQAAAVIGENSDIEIVEAHHRYKVDAPSGTALAMGQVIADTLGRDLQRCAVYGRQGQTGQRDKESIGFMAIRAGDIVGEHTAIFADIGERLEITHKASSRMTFARGALRAADWIINQPAGLYSMKDVLAQKG